MCVCVSNVCVCPTCVCVNVCKCVVSVIVKRPALPTCAVVRLLLLLLVVVLALAAFTSFKRGA